MKLIIIIVVLLALLGGGGFAAVTFAPTMVPIPVRQLLSIEVSDEEIAEAAKPKNTTLIDLDPLTIPIFENGTVDRFLVMHVLLEVEPGEKQAYVNRQLPRESPTASS